MKKSIFCIPLIFALILFAGQAFSQPPEDFRKPPSKEQIDKTRKRIETLKMWKLTESLNLDEETASKLFPLINQYDKERLAVQQKMRKDIRDLRETVGTAGEDELRKKIESIKDHHKNLQRINDEETGKVGEILGVRNMARYIIFKQDFDREMKKIIAKSRGTRPAKFKKQRDIQTE